MLYDAFTYFNEIDLLRVRMVEHAPFVDRFVVVEGSHRFTGAEKESFLDLADPRVREFRDRIVTVRVPLNTVPKSAWENEVAQRNAILTAVEYADDDAILVSDVDELVSRHHWPALLAELATSDLVTVRMCSMYYFLNLLTPEVFNRQKLVRVRETRRSGRTAHELRMADTEVPRTVHGWHFSFLGDIRFIQNKLNSFAHQEYNTAAINSPHHIARALASGEDLFGRFGRFTWVRVTDRWPTEMRANPFWRKYVARAPTVKDWVAGRIGGRVRRLP